MAAQKIVFATFLFLLCTDYYVIGDVSELKNQNPDPQSKGFAYSGGGAYSSTNGGGGVYSGSTNGGPAPYPSYVPFGPRFAPPPFPAYPAYPGYPVFDHNAFNDYFRNAYAHHQELISKATGSNGGNGNFGNVYASTGITYDNDVPNTLISNGGRSYASTTYNGGLERNAEIHNRFASGHFPNGQGTYATAEYGPGGPQQNVKFYPDNPNTKVETRFADVSDTLPPGAKSYGVFVSSSSGSGNVDGKPVNFRHAVTSVNDNGKITTYTAHDP